MSWLTQFLGIDQSNAQQEAVGKQQEAAANNLQRFGDIYNQNYSKLSDSLIDYKNTAIGEANWLGDRANTLLTNSQSQLTNEFKGALSDIFTAGRQQAAQSGLIGGWQESGIAAPQIAALGRSYASTLQQNQNQNNQALIGIYGQTSNLRLSPYAQSVQTYSNLTNQSLAGMSGAANTNVQAQGNYAQGPNPLGNLIGGIGGLLGGAGSFMSGGKKVGLF